MIQIRETPHPATYIGKGKIDEVNALLYGTDATGVICDDELSPAQIGNLERMLDTKVMDRTLLILDIFAGRAYTKEGNIQVELAQLKYRASKLTGQGTALSRLGGGIGTRGPGEKKLEMDRRLIRRRISHLKSRIKGCNPAPGGAEKTAAETSCAGDLHCRVYQRGKIHAAELPDRRRCSGRKSAD